MKGYTGIVVVLALLVSMTQGLQKTSPLMLQDGNNQDINVQLQNGTYNLLIFNDHFLIDPTTYFCFRIRTVKTGENNVCNLNDRLFNPYDCLQIVGTVSNGVLSSVTVNHFTSDHTLSNTNIVRTSNAATTSIGSAQLTVDINSFVGTSATINQIYQVWAGYRPDLIVDPLSKNAFFHTFRIASQTDSDDLMMQRHPHCFQFFHETFISINLIFYGGVLRGGNDTMFVHVLSYLRDNTNSFVIDTTAAGYTGVNLNAWIGFSFSKSHASRDMVAFITANSSIMDLYSLYYNAPYLDESENVIGTHDIITISDSAKWLNGANTHYFSGGIARLYNTGDNFGDEIIRKKMNNTYCYAISFVNASSTTHHSPILAANKHHDYECFTSFVALWEKTTLITSIGLVILALI